MTTQRDLLAAALHDVWCGYVANEKHRLEEWEKEADALLARGVRVVDGLTLTGAVRAVRHEWPGASYGLGASADVAAAILAALDAEP